MRKLLLTLSTCCLFALTSMVSYPTSDTFAKDIETVLLDELDAADIELGSYNITATLENMGDFQAEVTVKATIYNAATNAFVEELQHKHIMVQPQEMGAESVKWNDTASIHDGIYSVTVTVYEGYVDYASIQYATPIAEGEAMFDTENNPGGAADPVDPGDEGDEDN